MGNYAKYTVGSFSFHQVKVEEIENGLKITETFDTDIVERVISMNSFPFIRTTNEDGFDTYQILDNVGEIYNLPAKADEFILIDINGSTFLPSDGVELIEDSLQLAPFRKAGAVNEVVALGEITATTTSINLAVHSSGSNKVKLNGSLYIKSTQNNWTFPEITEDSTFLIYALPDSEIFHLTDTEVPNGGYLVRTVNIAVNGGLILEDKEYIPTASDAWRNVPLTTNPQWVQITAPFASTLNLIPNAAGREFAGVNTKFRKNGWDGKNIFLRNDSEFDLVLKPTETTAAKTTFYTFEEEHVLEAHAWKLFKIREVGGDFFLVEVVLGNNGGTTGDYIPLSGTEEGKPVTGDIELDDIGNKGGRQIFINSGELKRGFIVKSDTVMHTFFGSFDTVEGDGEIIPITGIFVIQDENNVYGALVDINTLSPQYPDSILNNTYITATYANKQHSYSTTETKTGGTWINGKPIYTITKLTADPIPADIDTRFPDEIIGTYTVYKYTKTSD